LNETGQKLPPGFGAVDDAKIASDKAKVIEWLKRSLEAVKEAHAGIKPADLQRRVTIEGREATVDGVYLRILVHANEHMGQLVAYTRMNGIVPPWSRTAK
jgi:uncharacterized damage-inducible protein DinB